MIVCSCSTSPVRSGAAAWSAMRPGFGRVGCDQIVIDGTCRGWCVAAHRRALWRSAWPALARRAMPRISAAVRPRQRLVAEDGQDAAIEQGPV